MQIFFKDFREINKTICDLKSVNDGRYYICRAFDNRAGGVIIAEVARKLRENSKNLPFGLYVCNCVQEEVGLRGAMMVSQRIKPNIALCTDVCHDTQSPFYNKIKQSDIKCGSGPVVGLSPSIHINLRKLIQSTAKDKNISIQTEFLSGTTGTDTDAFTYNNGGTPSALISLPLKYMHTTVEMINSEDLDNVIDLMYNTLLNIDRNFNVSYF